MLLALGAASSALDALKSLTSSKSSSSQSTGVTQDAANPFDLSGTTSASAAPPPPDPKGGGGGAADADVVPERSNGFAASWVTPVDCEDDDFDEVSDFRASSADDAAPRASSMTGLRQTPRSAAFHFHIG